MGVRGMVRHGLFMVALFCVLPGLADAQSAEASISIRKIDFRNFDYPACDGPTAQLRNGKHQYGDSEHDVAKLRRVWYVDLNGDGRNEAFVVVDWSSSGSVGGGVNAYVFAMQNGLPAAIWMRCNGRSGAELVGKTIKFYYPEYVGNDPNCCPSYKATDTYAWRRGGLTRISKKRKGTGY